MMPRPPSRASAIASLASVTVSIAAETIGMLIVIVRVNRVTVETSLGCTAAESAVQPSEVSTVTRLTRTMTINIPIVSAAMDTVTEARLAIALAREGGLGIIHRNLSIADQIAEVDKVKRSESGMIVEPVTLGPDDLLATAPTLSL